MYKKQKINAASQILSRGLLIFHKYLQNETQFWQFKEAEAKGEAIVFIETQLNHLPLETQENLIICYELQQKLNPLAIERTKAILTGRLSNIENYNKVSNLGILAEYEWLKAELEYNKNPNKVPILSLFEEGILLISRQVESILALDPERTIEKQFADYPMTPPSYEERLKELTQLVEQNKVIELGEKLLQSIRPTENRQLLPFPANLKEEMQKKLMVWIRSFVWDDETLSPSEKKATLSNLDLYMQFLEKQPDFECIACMALILDSLPDEYRLDAEHLIRWFRFGYVYRNIGFLRAADHAVLFQIDQEIEKNIPKLLQANIPNIDKINIQRHLHLRLAKQFEYYWEWEKAMQQYQKAAKLSLNIRNGQLDFEGALNSMIDCLQHHFQYRTALNLCFQFLQGNFKMLGVSESFNLSPTFLKLLEHTLINLVGKLQPPPKEVQKYLSVLQSETFKSFYETLEKMKKEDEISNENIEQLNQFFSNYLKETATAFGEEMTEEEQVKSALDLMDMFDYGSKELTEKLDNIAPFIANQSAELRLRYDINRAKLKYFQGDKTAIKDFEGILPLMELYPSFDKSKHINYRVEFLRAISLQIVERPSLIDKVEQLILDVINLKLVNFLDSFQEPSAIQIAAQDIEKVYKVLLINIKKVEYQREDQQRLLKILWNCLLVFKKFLNQFSLKTTTKILDKAQYNQQTKALKILLGQIYIHGDFDKVEAANYLSQKIRKLEHPYFDTKNRITQFNTPKNRSILYHFFTKMDNQRVLLTMTFKGNTFYHETFESFEKIENILQKIESNQTLTWRNMGILSALNQPESMNQVAQPVAHFFNYFYERRLDVSRFMSALQRSDQNKTKPTITKEELVHLYPDNFLHQFPIEILPFKHDAEKLLGTRFSLCNILNRDLGEWQIRPERGIAIFADVPSIGGFSALPHTQAEYIGIKEQFVSKQFPVYGFLQEAATCGNFQVMLTQKRPSILHFALHGVASSELAPETCALILCPEQNKPISSALLTYEDIIRLNLNAVDLVVLSACNSATGQIAKGTPMQGLAYAFLAAGASFVVASRVKTKDKATKLWMDKFYSYLFQTDISNAMRLTRTYFVENSNELSLEDIAAWGLWS